MIVTLMNEGIKLEKFLEKRQTHKAHEEDNKKSHSTRDEQTLGLSARLI